MCCYNDQSICMHVSYLGRSNQNFTQTSSSKQRLLFFKTFITNPNFFHFHIHVPPTNVMISSFILRMSFKLGSGYFTLQHNRRVLFFFFQPKNVNQKKPPKKTKKPKINTINNLKKSSNKKTAESECQLFWTWVFFWAWIYFNDLVLPNRKNSK